MGEARLEGRPVLEVIVLSFRPGGNWGCLVVAGVYWRVIWRVVVNGMREGRPRERILQADFRGVILQCGGRLAAR